MTAFDYTTGAPDAGDLLVSIINFRTAELTKACVVSVLEDLSASPDISARIAIVDNASGDGSVESLRDWIADLQTDVPVTLIASARNTGFSGGHNIGLAQARARMALVLNSDAVLRPGCCAALLAAMEAQPKAGLFAPRIEHEDGEQQINCFRVHSPASELDRGAATGPVSRLLRRWQVALDMPPEGEIGWASFACIGLRGTMLDQVGAMDEGYFLYFEDTEYGLRSRRAGWGIAYVPQARMVHYRGGSAPVKSLAKARKRLPAYYYASRTRFLYQAHGRIGLLAANLDWHLGRGISQLRRLTGRAPQPGVAHEARDIWINALRPLGPDHAPEGAGARPNTPSPRIVASTEDAR